MAKSNDVLGVTSEEWEKFFSILHQIVHSDEGPASEKAELVSRMADAKDYAAELQEFICWEFPEN